MNPIVRSGACSSEIEMSSARVLRIFHFGHNRRELDICSSRFLPGAVWQEIGCRRGKLQTPVRGGAESPAQSQGGEAEREYNRGFIPRLKRNWSFSWCVDAAEGSGRFSLSLSVCYRIRDNRSGVSGPDHFMAVTVPIGTTEKDLLRFVENSADSDTLLKDIAPEKRDPSESDRTLRGIW